jgi:DtxR family Mn-dependent transcriptional regulator
VNYERYGKITLTREGKKKAIDVLRKHRLWETFLYEKLSFTWDEVHELAEQLEHIQSSKLINKIDELLGYPEFDPHGDAIPDAKGQIKMRIQKTLDEVMPGSSCKMVAVKDNSATFLQYVVKVGLGISTKIKVVSKQAYDAMLVIEVKGKKHTVSEKFARNIFVVPELKD